MVIFEERSNIFPALIKARAAIQEITKDSKVKTDKYSYTYADLATINEAIQPHLAANGLAIVQEASTSSNNGMLVTVDTWLIHTSGEWIEFKSLTLPCARSDAQGIGSAISYARRYALMSALNLSTADDDGQAAQDAPLPVRPQSAQKAATPPKNAVDGDVLFMPETTQHGSPVASEAQLKRLHAVGREFYGNEWDEQRPKLVQAVSTGAVSSANDLTPSEANKLINGIQKKMAEVAERKAHHAQAVAA